MNFRTAAQKLAGGLSSDMAMDPAMTLQDLGEPSPVQPDPQSDDTDPATPGGAAMYNGATPFSEPVATDPEWRDPQKGPRSRGPVPYMPGPGPTTNTLHNARRESYENKINRETGNG